MEVANAEEMKIKNAANFIKFALEEKMSNKVIGVILKMKDFLKLEWV